MEFKELGLNPSLLRNIRDTGYETPTPIQQATIPLVLEGKDVLGCAQTGTGKTAAFALPILQRLKEIPPRRNAKVIRSLILSPTRELAMQTWENFQLYGKGEGLDSIVIFGGVGQGGQVEALHRGADIVIACPGRLLDLMGQGLVRLDWVDIFVLDEADRMLDMGFIHDVRKIVRSLPEQRQTLLFSATMPPEVEKLAMDLLTDPENVKVDPVTSTVEAIDQCLYYVDKVNKKHLLAQLLSSPEVESALVFSRTKHGVDRIVRDHRRPRHRRGRPQPCVQLRYAHGAGGLYPPDRPYRPRRQDRKGDLLLLHRRDEAAHPGGAPHRQAPAPGGKRLAHGGHHPHAAQGPGAPARKGQPPGRGPARTQAEPSRFRSRRRPSEAYAFPLLRRQHRPEPDVRRRAAPRGGNRTPRAPGKPQKKPRMIVIRGFPYSVKAMISVTFAPFLVRRAIFFFSRFRLSSAEDRPPSRS